MLWLWLAIVVSIGHAKVFGTRERAPEGWARVERAFMDVEIPFIIALKQQNLAVLDRLYWDRTNPGRRD
jgi:hypothetical protein